MNSVVGFDIHGNMNKYKVKMGCTIHAHTHTNNCKCGQF